MKILMWNRTRAANGFTSGISKRVTCGKGPIAETATTTRTVFIGTDGTLKNPRRARRILRRGIKRPRTGWCTERVALRCTRGYKQSVSVSQAALFLSGNQYILQKKKCSRSLKKFNVKCNLYEIFIFTFFLQFHEPIT